MVSWLFATTKSLFIWMCMYEVAMKELGLYLVVAKDTSNHAVASHIANATTKKLFIKKYKNYKQASLE